jgi:hypothetical protein
MPTYFRGLVLVMTITVVTWLLWWIKIIQPIDFYLYQTISTHSPVKKVSLQNCVILEVDKQVELDTEQWEIITTSLQKLGAKALLLNEIPERISRNIGVD